MEEQVKIKLSTYLDLREAKDNSIRLLKENIELKSVDVELVQDLTKLFQYINDNLQYPVKEKRGLNPQEIKGIIKQLDLKTIHIDNIRAEGNVYVLPNYIRKRKEDAVK